MSSRQSKGNLLLQTKSISILCPPAEERAKNQITVLATICVSGTFEPKKQTFYETHTHKKGFPLPFPENYTF